MTPEELLAEMIRVRDTPEIALCKNSAGTLHFSVEPSIADVRQVLRHLSAEGFKAIPLAMLTFDASKAKAIFMLTKSMRDKVKDVSQPDKAQTRHHEEFFRRTSSTSDFGVGMTQLWDIVLASRTLDPAGRASHEQMGQILAQMQTTLEDATKLKAQILEVLESVRSEAGSAVMSQHSKQFERIAAQHAKSAKSWRNWSIGMVLVSAVMIVLTGLTLILLPEEAALATRIEVGVFGAALISLVSFTVVFCVRNYFAARHNQVVNQHKADCLGTYDTFRTSSDPESKQAVLLQATQTIFSHQRTGYLAKEAEMASPNLVVEMARRIPAPPRE